MTRIAVNQIREIKKVYLANVKAYYKNEKDRLIKELAECEQNVLSDIRASIEKEVRAKNKNIKIKKVVFDKTSYTHEQYVVVWFDLSRNHDIIKSIVEASGISKDEKYEDNGSASDKMHTVLFKWEDNNMESVECDGLTLAVAMNCIAYKHKMKELNQWELEAIGRSHTGELPMFEIEAAEPTECIV